MGVKWRKDDKYSFEKIHLKLTNSGKEQTDVEMWKEANSY